ncbi:MULTISPECIES: alpha/beta hydrolase [unclassified Ruegeria]|uniref:COG3904 family protein n=1 Tax=unclassified Ruegeria TaxID=2625375 RepID=UPI0014897DA9|nr:MULTISPECIES: alpha/beta hydrolase [unclassified Ruegeria]NOD65314.1 alpha/beta hydrolase [Ruegeria sp. HKCCD6109]
MTFRFTSISACLALLASCGEYYTPVSFVAQGDQIIASGTIDETTLSAFEEVVAENPEARTLVLQYIEGSVDDDANVIFSREVHKAGFDTVVPSNGLVASGGTDLFLAGNRRILQPGACVGVHSWAGSGLVATELPEDDPEHDRYLDYFKDIGVDEEFYWYTLFAAPAESMHWMTAAEANRYDMTTKGAPALGSATVCDAR